jgi:ubiquinone/menaquinone biosynthesis C-methylase UbiE
VQIVRATAPFDAIADTYDHGFTESVIGRAQRRAVWKELERSFRPGETLLEVGCGTGEDACFLAQRRIRIVACDSSSRMVAIAQRKFAARGLSELAEARILAAESLSTLHSVHSFDGAYSNFGVLNCVQDLHAFARDLAGLLKAGATVLVCIMGRLCAWESAWYVAQGKPRKAFRRFRRGGVIARIKNDAEVRVHYPSIQEMTQAFAPEFQLRSFQGVGVVVPPSYVERWARMFPGMIDCATKLDSALAAFPVFRALGDHVLLRFERTSS